MQHGNHLPEWAWTRLCDDAWLRRTYLRLTYLACSKRKAAGLAPQEAPRIVEETLIGVARGEIPLPSGVSNPEEFEDWLFDEVAERSLGGEGR